MTQETKPIYEKYNLVVNYKIYSNDKILQFNGYSIEEMKINHLILEKYYSEEIINKLEISSENMIHYYFKLYKNQEKCTLFCNKRKTVILCGFYDGSVKIINLSKNTNLENKIIFPFISKEPIIVIKTDSKEKFLFFGNFIGNIIVYSINFENLELEEKFFYNGHLTEISAININNELNLWISASIDGIINLYTFPAFKLVRSKKIKSENKIEFAFLSASTLPSIIVIASDNKNLKEIYSYSINGKLLEHIKDLNSIMNSIIIKDFYFNEYLMYISKEENNIIIRSLPFLNVYNTISGFDNISNICISEDLKILYAISNKDEQIYIVKDSPKQAISN